MRLRLNPLALFLMGSAAVLGDAYTTWLALHAGHREANPIGREMIGALGLGPALMLRVIFGVALFYAMVRIASIAPRYQQVALAWMMLVVCWVSAVVVSNAIQVA